MLLSEIATHYRTIEVLRDADVRALTFDIRHAPPYTLTYCGSEVYVRKSIAHAHVTAILTTPQIAQSVMHTMPEGTNKGLAVSDSPKVDFFKLHNYLAEKTEFYRRPNRSSIGAGCTISKWASIDEQNVVIGDNVVIEDFVRISANTTIGNGTIIRSGTVIGGDGFQFLRLPNTILKVAHAGGVWIGENVEIQSSCMIDRHIFGGDTRIGNDTKLADGVHIAHCAQIGARTLIAAGAIVLGSAAIGDDVWIGPGAVISNEIDIGNAAYITLGAVVTRNVAAGERVTGNFAIAHERFLQHLRTIR